MAEFEQHKNFKALVAEVKKSPGNSERYYSDKCKIPMNEIGKQLYHAEVEADPKLKIAATGASIARAAKAGNLRWPRIAAYAGITLGQAKKLYEEHTGEVAPSNLTNRGRRFDGTAPAAKSGASGRRTTAKKEKDAGTSGRRRGRPPGSKSKTAPAAKRGAAKRGAVAGRRGTRAGAVNPR